MVGEKAAYLKAWFTGKIPSVNFQKVLKDMVPSFKNQVDKTTKILKRC
jgi:hypothetical protein